MFFCDARSFVLSSALAAVMDLLCTHVIGGIRVSVDTLPLLVHEL